MTLRHFDTELDLARQASTTTVVVTEEVTVTPKADTSRAWLTNAPEHWTWEQLRDYVVHEIEARFGAFPRNFKTEHSIFKSFVSRWGPQAGPIAVHAFDTLNGYWAGAPISVNRFCRNSDKFFASEIAERL